MPEYTEPSTTFDPNSRAVARIKSAKQFRNKLLNDYKRDYERFWQTSSTHGKEGLSMQQMQSVIDEAQATFQSILADSAAYMDFFEVRYPEAFTGDNPKMPAKYKESAYTYSVVDGAIVLESIRQKWAVDFEVTGNHLSLNGSATIDVVTA